MWGRKWSLFSEHLISSLWGVHDVTHSLYTHYILLNLSVLGLCLRINDSGLFAWISLTVLSHTYFIAPIHKKYQPKNKLGRILLKITRPAYKQSYLVIDFPNLHEIGRHVGSNIAQIHSLCLLDVISEYYLCQFT